MVIERFLEGWVDLGAEVQTFLVRTDYLKLLLVNLCALLVCDGLIVLTSSCIEEGEHTLLLLLPLLLVVHVHSLRFV